MRENLILIWFFNNDCEYCVDLEDEVKEFAHSQGAFFQPVLAGIIDEETGEPAVPAIMYNDPRVENHMFVGRFCLDALRYCLEQG
jgi:hypothetical protein